MSGEHGHPEYVTADSLQSVIDDLVDALDGRYAPAAHTHSSEPEPGPFPGAPPPGMFLIGATTRYHGNTPQSGYPNDVVDPYLKYEKPTGVALSTYRSYATPSQWSNDASLRRIIERDIAAGRTPMPSWKTPGDRSWADIANGAEDQELDAKLEFMGSFAPHPIHAILHHEPDNVNNNSKGSPADYIAMYRRFRQRMEVMGVTNVSLNLNIIGYMFNSAAARSNPSHPRYMDNWWEPGTFDFVSFDPYARDLEDPVMGRIEDWCEANDAPWMIVEWGYKEGSKYGEDHSWSKQEVLDFHQRLRDNPLCFGSQVWDSDQNGDPYLVTQGQLEAIHELMLRPDTYRV